MPALQAVHLTSKLNSILPVLTLSTPIAVKLALTVFLVTFDLAFYQCAPILAPLGPTILLLTR
jgi:hypothetical protein